jgi:diaminopimelate epimerase
MNPLKFFKYQGTGNDFVMLDNRVGGLENELSTDRIQQLCDRRFGVGADGLILLSPDPAEDFRMIYYNADGKESSMCGNGGRCVVAFARQLGLEKETYRFQAIDGLHEAAIDGEEIRLKMGKPHGYRQIDERSHWIDTGSPHLVQVLRQPLAELNVMEQGRRLRRDPAFAPGGVNVNFVNRLGPNELQVRTYERGVEAETLSCGTGVTACAYISALLAGKSGGFHRYTLHTPGGSLKVELQAYGQESEAVWLIGPATFVFAGEIG